MNKNRTRHHRAQWGRLLAALLSALLITGTVSPVFADTLSEEGVVQAAETVTGTENGIAAPDESAEISSTEPEAEIISDSLEIIRGEGSADSGITREEESADPEIIEGEGSANPENAESEESSSETSGEITETETPDKDSPSGTDAEEFPEEHDGVTPMEEAGGEPAEEVSEETTEKPAEEAGETPGEEAGGMPEGDAGTPIEAELVFGEDEETILEEAEGAALTAAGQVIVGTNGMPTINIILAGTTLDQIKRGSKDTKYSGNTADMTVNGTGTSQTDVEIKGRGNSTWNQTKKPFQIKFDKKQDLFGQGKAKKWILLANDLDRSQLRNDIGLTLASKNGIPGALPQGQFIEVYFNGVYEGLYYLTRKVEVGTVPLKDDKGIIVEFEHIREPDEPSGYSTGGSRLSTKETVIDSKDMSEQKAVFDNFMKSYNAFEKAVMNKDWRTASQYADMQSFARHFLLSDFTGGQDMFGSSCYMFKDGDGDVIHAGPMWDFDLAYGNNVLSLSKESKSPYRTWAYMDVRECPNSIEVIKKWAPLYEYLMNMPEFRELVRTEYWGSVRKTLAEVSQSIGQRSTAISDARRRDLAKWHTGSSGGTESAAVEKYMKERTRYFDLLYGDVLKLGGFYDLKGAYKNETVRASRTADGYYVFSNRSGAVLDVIGAKKADGAGVQWTSYNKSDAQKWLPLASGAIISKETGFVLTGSPDGGYTIRNVAFSGNGPSAAQKFTFTKTTVDIASAVKNTTYAVTKASDARIPAASIYGKTLKEGEDYTLAKSVSETSVRWTFTGIGFFTGKKEVSIRVANSGGLDGSVFYRISSKLDRTKVLTVGGSSLKSGGNVQLESFSGSLEDYWFLEAQADGTYCIRNARSGMALDVKGGMTANNTNVQQYTPNGTTSQRFIIGRQSDGTYEVIGLKSQKAVDVAGGKTAENTNIQIYTPNDTRAQRWYIEAVGRRPDISGTYRIVSCAGKADKAVSVNGTSKANGANIFLWDAATSASAKWVLSENKDLNRTWSIRSSYSGKALDVAQDGTRSGTNVCQNAFAKDDNSFKWVLMKNERDNTYTIFSICSGLALDVSGGSGSNRANIQIYTPNGTRAQKWIFKTAA